MAKPDKTGIPDTKFIVVKVAAHYIPVSISITSSPGLAYVFEQAETAHKHLPVPKFC